MWVNSAKGESLYLGLTYNPKLVLNERFLEETTTFQYGCSFLKGNPI